MQDDMNQRISQLIDADLNNKDTLELLKTIRLDESLRKKMIRYQAISQSIKTGKFETVSSDFVQSITAKIEQEPTYLLPPKHSSPAKFKIYATAASVLAVVVLAGQVMWRSHPANDAQAIALAQNSTQSKSFPFPNSTRTSVKGKPLNAEFNAYLQAHNSSFYTNGEAYYQPDAKVASFGR
jgi:negative regulator of sigma E activity